MDKEKERERAKQQIIRYGQAWGWQSVDLACHAAFPLAVTPELLYLLRENFLPDCPWIAIADFLLSPLCLTVGDELYEMEAIVRDILLSRLATDFRFGETRLNKLADFIAIYIEAKLPESPRIAKYIGTDPQWIAFAYIKPGSASRLQETISQLLKKEGAKVHQRLATFLDAQEDVLIAAGLEPLVTSTYWQLETGVVLQPFSIEVATIAKVEEEKPRKLEFSTVNVNKRGQIIRTQPCEAYYYEEPLGEGVESLTMIAIPEGEFMMGSPEDEKDRYDDESPRHEVKVAPFYMSQTPITQAQWKFVVNLPQIKRKLKPNPSRFKGDDNPVEKVSWYDAIEFCGRLCRHSGRQYRLASEAEWEYACRAGTRTPFHFGETISTELANYSGAVVYQEETAGEYREKTTPVRTFKPNAFGLYDMHGNVWEWCLDPWHENYQDAPKDGRVWDEGSNDNRYQNILDNINVLLEDERPRIFRGGSWDLNPRYCRSAYRFNFNPDFANIYFGFRVVCGLPSAP